MENNNGAKLISCLNKYKIVILLIIIIGVGIFLRTYHFRDWLQFSPDQARDATLIRDVIDGKTQLPLVGPQAGNTRFSLGPLYYYFQYVSALLFGVTPQTMAYPDVFFSILAIPLLFIFLRKYFSINIALALTAIMSVSYFSVLNSRFASNPNSIPFFLLLFLLGLLGMMDEQYKERLLWPTLAGIGLGVGIQQHTLLLISLPFLAITIVIWLWKKKSLNWKGFTVSLFLILLLNTGQIMHEWQTNGGNVKALVSGVGDRSGGRAKFVENAGLIAACQLQANAHIISSLQDIETCGGMFKVSRAITRNGSGFYGLLKNGLFVLGMLITLIFSLGGYYLGWRAYRNEIISNRRDFLFLSALFNLFLFLVFIPVAGEVSVRYFIVLFFVPIVLMGLWLDFILEKFSKKGKPLSILIIVLLIMAGLTANIQAGVKLANGQGSGINNSFLADIEPMLAYILQEADSSQKNIYIVGRKMYRKRFFKPLNFLATEKGASLILADDKNNALDPGTQAFYIAKRSQKIYQPGDLFEGHRIENIRIFNLAIMIVELRW